MNVNDSGRDQSLSTALHHAASRPAGYDPITASLGSDPLRANR